MKFSLIYADIAGIKETHHKNKHNDELEFNLVNESLNKQTNKQKVPHTRMLQHNNSRSIDMKVKEKKLK